MQNPFTSHSRNPSNSYCPLQISLPSSYRFWDVSGSHFKKDWLPEQTSRKRNWKLAMAAYTFHPSTSEAEIGRFLWIWGCSWFICGVPGHPKLHSKILSQKTEKHYNIAVILHKVMGFGALRRYDLWWECGDGGAHTYFLLLYHKY